MQCIGRGPFSSWLYIIVTLFTITEVAQIWKDKDLTKELIISIYKEFERKKNRHIGDENDKDIE